MSNCIDLIIVLDTRQSQFKDINDEDLKAMDTEISELNAELQSLTQNCRQLDAGVLCTNSSQIFVTISLLN